MPLCAECKKRQGLCIGCATFDRAILPQIATPRWVKLIVSKPPNPAPRTPSVPDLPALGQPGRKKVRRLTRLARALHGEHTRTTKAKEAA